MAAPCVSLHPPINAENETERAENTFVQIFGMTRPGIELNLPALVTCALPAVPLKR